ncbi:DUF4974 domain-containing protein [Sphingobacterium alkalisoli]|uniref:DUF4974 domain-containing protein n=1 Tax=Sphingobacterium alkalisoli TaxID=1874115 RepID=A0A4U0GX27_9SPHI|nr:FecR family protein [Sphingobacterium alkalisoli]TJY63721.1 DUF4974 domain-containing protein [Sphingobacterium alkalisoli]GGH25300.1 iron dicitrate transporter FecR [Sphingobacterium alkalisoli]
MDSNQHILQLYKKFLTGKATREETEDLLSYFGQSSPEALRGLIRAELELEEDTQDHNDPDEVTDRLLLKIKHKITERQAVPILTGRFKRWLPYAAAMLFLLGVSTTYFYFYLRIPEQPQLTSKYGDDVLPGTNKATLTLGDGIKYELNDSKEGILIGEDGIRYEDGTMLTGEAVFHATVITPNGGQYRVTLPDGTKVILNAASSLSYPSRFSAAERLVTLDGEGYFEVAHNPSQPFRVKSNTQQIEVLGTAFNASTYNADKAVTTLIEGRVNLHAANTKNVVLNPGQQSVLENGKFKVEAVSTDDYISWVHNQFVFNDTPLEETFAQLERWYDVTFDYPKATVNERIYAEIGRNRKLSEVLNTLEEIVDLKFTIEGRRVTVRK